VMSRRLLLLFFTTVLALHSSAASDEKPAKVLVYSIQSGFSHVNFMGRLADTLAEGGMNVTLLLSQIRTAVGSGTTASRVLTVDAGKEAVEYFNDPANDESKTIFDGSSHDFRSMLNFGPVFSKLFYLQCSHLLAKTDLLETLRAEKYDVILTETFDHCGFGIAKVIGVKSVIPVYSSSLNDYTAWITATPSPWSSIQSAYSAVIDRSLSTRLWNLICVMADFRVHSQYASAANRAFRERFGDDFPTVEDIIANSSLIITAGDPLLDLPRPTLRKIVDIGAIGIREARPLDKEYDTLLNLRPKTVVFSLGSVAQAADMPEVYKRGLVAAFSRFPEVTFIWKYEKPEEDAELIRGIDNVIMRKWIPQNDLLGDARISALITHGGKTSLNEVGAKGLPTVFIPIYGDQPRNAAIAVNLGFGVFLNKQDLADPDIIAAAISEVLNDEKYTIAAKNVADMIRSRPFSAKELLVKHVQFHAKFGNVKSMEMEGLDYPLYLYWNVDIILLLSIILITPFVALYCCCSGYVCIRSS
ncbi:hypothetical protein PFISCL1PPCAC_13490, partial [Pristionchus fissidentatus]